jgi:hypothetical protein
MFAGSKTGVMIRTIFRTVEIVIVIFGHRIGLGLMEPPSPRLLGSSDSLIGCLR